MIAAVAAGTMLLTGAAIPLASADDLDDRKKRVQGAINKTMQHLDQSSAELVQATQALRAAQGKLVSAQQHLAKTRGELAAAEALDRQMQVKLDAAVAALRQARAELAEGRANLAKQEVVLSQIAAQNYQTGDPSLLGLSMVLTSQDPAELTNQLSTMQSLLEKESGLLQRLDATRVVLTLQEEKVEAAKREVAVQRQAAAENLERKQALEAEAETAAAQVAQLVAARTEARAAAQRARTADLRRLNDLAQERDRISALLRQRAEEARRRAEAARRAAAAAGRGGGSADTNGYLDYPVNGYITSYYGMRFHPVYRRWSLHDGIDIGAGCGTPIRASVSGEVVAMYYNAGYGNRVIVDSGYHRGVGLATAYNHLSGYATYVGDKVQRGEIIGYVGTTGYSTGCHLHFMVFENGRTVDPMQWL